MENWYVEYAMRNPEKSIETVECTAAIQAKDIIEAIDKLRSIIKWPIDIHYVKRN